MIQIIELQGTSITEQLKYEEDLLRKNTENFCVINRGSPTTIVMGISSDPALLLNQDQIDAHKIPVIRRFSGGGTVVIDENTLFVSFIFNKDFLPIAPFPEAILRWTKDFYASSWKIPGFDLQAQDYVIGNRKCGGNAQYITKNRWLHHTSFLWDYSPKLMACLTIPLKQPAYRQQRSHDDFLIRLKDAGSTLDQRIEEIKVALINSYG
jgi:lipoate-protein ligase A